MIRRPHLVAFALIAVTACAEVANADKIWWTHNAVGGHWIQRANLNGSKVEDLLVNLGAQLGVAIDPGDRKLYWTHFGGPLPTGIYRFNLADGANQEMLVDFEGVRLPHAIVLDLTHGKMYWTEAESFEAPGSIHRANLDGSDVEDLITTDIEFPRGIALDVPRGKLYWTDFDLGLVNRANLDGSNIETIIDGAVSARGIAIDETNRKLYWADSAIGMQRSDLDGSNVEMLLLSGADGIALDVSRGHIYWTNFRLNRADLDGQNWLVLTDEHDVMPGIALDLGPPPPIPAVSTWGVVVLLLLVLATGTIAFRTSFHPVA